MLKRVPTALHSRDQSDRPHLQRCSEVDQLRRRQSPSRHNTGASPNTAKEKGKIRLGVVRSDGALSGLVHGTIYAAINGAPQKSGLVTRKTRDGYVDRRLLKGYVMLNNELRNKKDEGTLARLYLHCSPDQSSLLRTTYTSLDGKRGIMASLTTLDVGWYNC